MRGGLEYLLEAALKYVAFRARARIDAQPFLTYARSGGSKQMFRCYSHIFSTQVDRIRRFGVSVANAEAGKGQVGNAPVITM